MKLRQRSLEPGPSSSFSGNLQRPIIDNPVNCPETESLGRVMGEFQRPIIDQTVNCTEMERLGSGMGGFREKNETLEGSLVNLVEPGSEISGIDEDSVDYANRGTSDDAMPLDLEGEHEVEESVDGVGKRFSEPYFLRRVLREELDGDGSVKKTGLALPPCLMRLPVELKLKILESLSGVDVARTASVCTELRRLASNNELWKQKFEEEFGNANVVQGTVNWKERFVSSWVRRSWVSRKGKRSVRPRLYINVGD